MPVVRTTLSLLLILARTTTLNFSSSHIQLALSRNFRIPPSVCLPFHSSLVSASQVSICCTVFTKKEERPDGYDTICMSFCLSEVARNPTAECSVLSHWCRSRAIAHSPLPAKAKGRSLQGLQATRIRPLLSMKAHTGIYKRKVSLSKVF